MQITKIKDRQCQNIQSDAAYVQRKFQKWLKLFRLANELRAQVYAKQARLLQIQQLNQRCEAYREHCA